MSKLTSYLLKMLVVISLSTGMGSVFQEDAYAGKSGKSHKSHKSAKHSKKYGKAAKVGICHSPDDGAPFLMNVTMRSQRRHIKKHEDFLPDPVFVCAEPVEPDATCGFFCRFY